MKVRIAESRDLPALVDIYNQSIMHKRTAALRPVTLVDREAWFTEHASSQYPILIAEKDGDITGYLFFSAYRAGRDALRFTAEVSYFVDFKHHRQGIASRLMEAALDMCDHLKIKNLFAILLENNTASIGLLKKYGFEQWAYLPSIAEIDGREFGQFYYGKRIVKGMKEVI